MTEREALKLALEALEKSHTCPLLPDDCAEAITAIKEALAQPEHGWTSERIAGIARLKEAQDKKLAQPEQHQDWCASLTQMLLSMPPKPAPCNCKPPQRKPLTDEQRDAIARQAAQNDWHDYKVIDAVEAAHGIKENK